MSTNIVLTDLNYQNLTTGTTVWEKGTGLNSIQTIGTGCVASGDYSVAEGYQTTTTLITATINDTFRLESNGNSNYFYSSGSKTFYVDSGNTSKDITSYEGYSSNIYDESGTLIGTYVIYNTTYNSGDGYSTFKASGFTHANIAWGPSARIDIVTLTTTFGNYAHVEGGNSISSGSYSHAEGFNTTASGYASHAEGNQTTASGQASHAEGYGTTASGYYSHAEGANNIANGNGSHSEGLDTKASGQASHSEGTVTTASGYISHSEGSNTTASGDYSHSQNKFTIAATMNSTTEGFGSVAGLAYLDATYNNTTQTISFPVGINYVSKFTVADSISLIDVNNLVSKTAVLTSVTYDLDLSATTLGLDIALGSDYIGTVTNLTTSAAVSLDASHSEGYQSIAYGNISHAEGVRTIASGNYSHAQGNETTASGNYSHAEGNKTKATECGAHAEGYQTTASGYYSHAGGENSVVSGYTSFVHSLESYCEHDYSAIIAGSGITSRAINTVYVPQLEIVYGTKSSIILTDLYSGSRYNVFLSGGTLTTEII